jgi:hypothetical protein
VNRACVLIVGLLALMGVAALLDVAFNLGLGRDSQILWATPPMVLFALLVRFCALAIFKFVGRHSYGFAFHPLQALAAPVTGRGAAGIVAHGHRTKPPGRHRRFP